MNKKQMHYFLCIIAIITLAALIESRTDTLSRAVMNTTDAIHHVFAVLNYESQNMTVDNIDTEAKGDADSSLQAEQLSTLQASANKARKIS